MPLEKRDVPSILAQWEASMVTVPSGAIVLHDARRGRQWTVSIEPFRLACHPVTKALHASVRGHTAIMADGREPVTDVSWDDAIRFCNELSHMAGLVPCYTFEGDGEQIRCDFGANGYRLPSEAEWEHACRAGTGGSAYGALSEIAWYEENAESRVHPVGQKAPNPWGLHDMLGNVWEWCWDRLDPEVYGDYRVFRGGGWADPYWSCRASCRRGSHPTFRIDDLGFRIARSRVPQ